MIDIRSLEIIGEVAIRRHALAAKALVAIHGHKTVANRLGVHENTLKGWMDERHQPKCDKAAMLMEWYSQEVVDNSCAEQKVGD